MRIRLLAILVALLLQACIYVPRTTEVYDADCQVTSKKMDLQPVQIAAFGGCSDSGCVTLLVAAGATAVASAVISGSIVVVGNVVYWFEKQGRCKPAANSLATPAAGRSRMKRSEIRGSCSHPPNESPLGGRYASSVYGLLPVCKHSMIGL